MSKLALLVQHVQVFDFFFYFLLKIFLLSLQGYEVFIPSLVVNPCTQKWRGKINNGAPRTDYPDTPFFLALSPSSL